MKQPDLTNEALQKVTVTSSFELSHYAIALARYWIRSGREVHLGDVIKEILKHPHPSYLHQLEELDNIQE